jgi:molybdopterin converting factor small subunit
MAIKANIPYFVQHLTSGVQVVEVGGSTVGECLKNLVAKFPAIEKELFDKEGKLPKHFNLYLNDEKTPYPEGLTRPVKDGDELSIEISLLAGG